MPPQLLSSLLSVLLLLLLKPSTAELQTLTVPAAFSSNQKTSQQQITTHNLRQVLQKYELDTHVEVVLLGDFSASSLSHLEEGLEQLSRLGAAGSSLDYVREKILFHVSLAKQIETPLEDLLERQKSSEREGGEDKKLAENVLEVLGDYHHKLAATRTLFVTHLSEPLFTQTYVSPHGFAFLDIHSNSVQSIHGGRGDGDVKPIFVDHDTIPAPSFFTKDSASFYEMSNFYDLAIQIYRSAEGLLPVPLPFEDRLTLQHVHDSLPTNEDGASASSSIPHMPPTVPTRVHLQLITLCGHPLKQCQPDVISIAVLESLTRESFSFSHKESSTSITGLHITQSSSLLRISSSIPLMAAVLASCQRFQRSKSRTRNSEVVYISPTELLAHLKDVPEIIDHLEEHLTSKASDDTFVLPIFSLLLPDDWEGLLSLDEYSPDNDEALQHRFCDRGLFEYGPNVTRPGTMMSCHPFTIKRQNDKTSHRHQRLSKLISSDFYNQYESKATDDNDDELNFSQRSGFDTALVVLRSSGEEASSTLLPGLVRSFFTSTRMLAKTGKRLVRDTTYQSSELYNAIVQVVWDYSPPHVYYSPSSQQIVTDYFWFDALAWGMSDSGGSSNSHFNVNNNNFNHGGDSSYDLHRKKNFRQSTLFSRLRVFQVAEELLVRAARSSHLLDLLTGSAVEKGEEDSKSEKKNFRKSARGKLKSDSEIARTELLFASYLQSFMQQMHTVSVAFSHAEYKDALELANEAEGTVLALESALHSSELRSTVKHERLFLDEKGNVQPEDITVSCTEKHSYMYHFDEGDAENQTENDTFLSRFLNSIKVFLTSSTADYCAIFTGLIMGVGGMTACLYMKRGPSRKKYSR